MTGVIFAVKRFAVHDGPGIRTTVFLKGCPLACLWCHNPEGKSFAPELAVFPHKCIACGSCVPACPENAHGISAAGHVFDRAKCRACGACERACLGDALVLYGRRVTPEELLPELLADRPFYETSGGGITLSGGECLAQPGFSAELAQKIKAEGLSVAIDTCGFVPRAAIDAVLPYTDLFLYDIKAFSPETHKRCTGQGNALIWENLAYINEQKKPVEIRIPLIPGYNDAEIPAIADRLAEFSCVTRVSVLPYHNFSGSKYDALGMENTMPPVDPPDASLLRAAVDALRARGLNAQADSLK